MRPFAPLALLALLCTAAAAQVPDGFYVVSSFGWTGGARGGLFLLHPRLPGATVVVQGLGPDLTGGGLTSVGANCVSIRSDDQMLLVGELAPANASVDLHELALAGNQAIVVRTTSVGIAGGTGGGINQIAMLPDGDAVFCISGLINGPPLNGARLGRFARATGSVTPIPVPAFGTMTANAIAVDRTGTTIYTAVQVSGANMAVHAVPIAGGTPVLITNITSGPGLAVRSDGTLFAAELTGVSRIDPATGVVTPFGAVGANLNGLALEAATDLPVCVLNGIGSGPGAFWLDAAGTATLLSAGITGVGSGIAVNDSPRAYGTSTPGTIDYRWRVAPAPGGLPRRGNTAFGLRVDGLGGTAGFLVASALPADLPLLGMRVLLDPNGAVTIGLITPGSPLSAPIPVGLAAGLRFHFQSFHLDAGAPGGIAASNGQLVGIVQ